MTLVQGRRRPCCKRSPAAPSIAHLDSSPPPKLGDKLSDQPAGPSGTKPPITNAPAAINVSKYSENDLQRIFKAIPEAQAPVLALGLALIVTETLWKKLKACSLDVYRGKSHMNCYNFYQQCENYFATAGTMESTWILFATIFVQDWISFRWQQYKRRHDADTLVSITWDKFKAFYQQSLGNSQVFVDTY